MTFRLSEKSKAKLVGVHPKLVAVVERAIQLTDTDFIVTCGTRSMAEQKQLKAKGATKTLNSRHVPDNNKSGLSCAVDLAPLINGEVRWDWPLFYKLNAAMERAAKELNVPIEWGGKWRTFKDGPHFQLPWQAFP